MLKAEITIITEPSFVFFQLYIRGIKRESTSKIAVDNFKCEECDDCPNEPPLSTPSVHTTTAGSTAPVPILWHCSLDKIHCGMEVTGDWMNGINVEATPQGKAELKCIKRETTVILIVTKYQ